MHAGDVRSTLIDRRYSCAPHGCSDIFRGAMQRRALHVICCFGCLAVLVSAFAQEGHPLTGTWSGDWGPTPTQRTHLTLVLSWDGKNVTGTMNPGPDAVQIANVFLDVTNWTVRIETDAKDQSGKPVHVSAEGKIEDLSSAHRKIIGTWMQGSTKGDFRLTRD